MLLSGRVRYRHQHRPEATGRPKGGNYVTLGEFGLQTTTTSWIASRQIESARIVMARYMKRGGKVRTKIFPHTSYVKESLEARTGAGRDTIEDWIAVVKLGRILPEVVGVSEEAAREALCLASRKLSVKIKLVKCEELGGETNES